MAIITQSGLGDFPHEPISDEYGNLTQSWHIFFSSLVDKLPRVQSFTIALNPSTVPANSTSEETVTVAGLNTNDVVTVVKPADMIGLMVEARVSAPDTLNVRFGNLTGAGIDPGLENYTGVAIRL